MNGLGLSQEQHTEVHLQNMTSKQLQRQTLATRKRGVQVYARVISLRIWRRVRDFGMP